MGIELGQEINVSGDLHGYIMSLLGQEREAKSTVVIGYLVQIVGDQG